MKNPVSELFGRSPIKPLQEHMAVVAECTRQLDAFVSAALAGDWGGAEQSYDRIRDLEHRGDEMKREFRLHMPKSLFMPVPRTDLLELISLQDKVANITRDIAGIMLGRKMTIPEALQADFRDFIKSAGLVTDKAGAAIDELDELLESGFKGKEVDIIAEMIDQLDACEMDADIREREIRGKLMAMEEELPPLNAMFLYNIIEKIGNLADRSQKVGSRLQLLLAR